MASIQDLPGDVTRSVLYLLDDTDLMNACSVNKDFSNRLCNDSFWLNKIINKYGLTAEQINKYKKDNTYLAYYLKLNEDTKNRNPADILRMIQRLNFYGREDLVIIALNRGADIHNKDDEALRYASSHSPAEIVRLLLENGADVHARNDESLKRVVGRRGTEDVVKLLLEYGADVHARNDEALTWASLNGSIDTVKLLLEYGADVHARNDEALSRASEYGHIDIVKLLLEYGADVHANNDGALRAATTNGHREIAELLLKQTL